MKRNRNILQRLFFVCFLLTLVNISIVAPAQNDQTSEEEEDEAVQEVVIQDTAAIEAKIEFPVYSDEVLEERIKNLQKDIKLTYNSTIRGFINYFTVRNRRYALVMERRRNLYFPIFEEALKRHNMPDELKYLAIVESGLNPVAKSRVGAAGLWQFMPPTGRMYGLYQDEYIDERLDPYKSTEAACKYLKELYGIFHDWELALASYNCGPGNIRRAIRRSGYKDNFWEVYRFLPQETRSYVPQFVALTYVMNHLEDHSIVADSIEYPMDYDTILVHQPINIDVLCSNLNICTEDFLKLNPSIKKNIFPGNPNFPLRIPVDKHDDFLANRMDIMDSCTKYCEAIAARPYIIDKSPKTITPKGTQKKIVYVVKKGDVLSKVANKYKVSMADIKKWNRLRGNSLKVGQKLAIYKSAGTKVSKQENTAKTVVVSGKKPQVYYVQPGDTLWTISKKYEGISVDDIKKLNKLKGNDLKIGQKLILG